MTMATPSAVHDILASLGHVPECTTTVGPTVAATFRSTADAIAARTACKTLGHIPVQFGAMLVFSRLTEKDERELVPLKKELTHARAKFPHGRYLFSALAEEIGEMAEAWREDPGSPHARHEALQVACVAMRIATEGTLEGESPTVLDALQGLEALARDFFASLNRPDLVARSEPQELHVPGVGREKIIQHATPIEHIYSADGPFGQPVASFVGEPGNRKLIEH